MALVVEDGTGKVDSNTYVDLADIRAYALARGVTLSADDTVLESQVFQAMDYLESKRDCYQGKKVYPETPQALQWPRYPVYIDGFIVDASTIPTELKDAECQLVMQVHAGVDLMPTSEDAFITEEKVGPLTTKYSDKIRTSLEPQMNTVKALLQPLYKSGCGQYGLKTIRV